MIGISVKGNVKDVLRDLNDKQKHVIPQAAARALNRVINTVKSRTVKDISAKTKLKQKDIRARMIIRGASKAKLEAVLKALPYSPNLSKFSARQTKPGVVANAWEGRKVYRGTFTMPGGSVVKRTTKARYPIKGVYGPSLISNFKKQDNIELMKQVAGERWSIEFEHEVARRLSRL